MEKALKEIEESGARIMNYRENSQHQWIFLYYCFQPLMTHFMRALPKEFLEPYLIRFDTFKRNILSSILRQPITDAAWLQAIQPLSYGGFGLFSSLVIADKAYFASTFAVKEFVQASCRNDAAFGVSKWNTTLQASIHLAGFVDGGANIPLRGLQRTLNKRVLKANAEIFLANIKSTASLVVKARVLGQQSTQSGAYLLAIPQSGGHEPEFAMSDSEFRTAATQHLGLPFTFISPTLRCSTCATKPFIGIYGEHFICCTAGNEKIMAHHNIVRKVMRMAQKAGVSARREPEALFAVVPDLGHPEYLTMKPDIIFQYNPDMPNPAQQDSIYDVCITDPTSQTNLSRNNSATKSGGSAVAGAKRKIVMYDRPSSLNGLRFKPLLVERFGYMHSDFSKLLVSLAKVIATRESRPFSSVLNYWVKSFSVCLQKGQARVLLGREAFHRVRSDANPVAMHPLPLDDEDEDPEDYSQDLFVYDDHHESGV
jgi:hypothetical protein